MLRMRVFVLSCVLIPQILSASSPITVEVNAKKALLMNAETGAVIWEKNGYAPLYPASTTKLIAALYVAENAGGVINDNVTATYDAVTAVQPSVRRANNGAHPPYRLEFGGTHIGIKVGETLPFRALLYGMMLASGNDAANVIAEHVSGSVPTFMEELNRFVQKKGCKNTVLYTPHGLPHDEHKTTCYDLAILGKECIKNPLLREVVSAPKYVRPATNMQSESNIVQFNALVRPGHKYYYPKAIGIKTGFTNQAGWSIVAAAEDENRTLIAVVMDCDKQEQRFQDAIALFEAGFNEKKVSRTLLSKGFDLFTHQVEGAASTLQAYLSDDIVLQYYPSEEPVFKTSVHWQAQELPIALGQRVGDMRVYTAEGKVLASAPLFAARAVEATMLHRANLAWKKVKRGLWENVTLVLATGGIVILASTFYYAQRKHRKNRLKLAERSKKGNKFPDR